MAALDRTKWASDFLRRIGAPVNSSTLAFMYAWMAAEGGMTHNSAMWNPLNTTQGGFGGTSINSVGVKSYSDYETGMRATLATLNNGRYAAIIAALKAGNGAAARDAVIASPWSGSSHYSNGRGFPAVGSSTGGVHGTGGAVTTSTYANAGGSTPPAGQDKLSPEELAEQYGWAKAFFDSDPDLQRLFRDAVNNQWSTDEFQARLRATKWWQRHSASYRQYELQRTSDPAQWKAVYDKTSANVNALAVQIGAKLSSTQLDTIAKQVMMFGWDEVQLKRALGQYVVYQGGSASGQAGEFETQLRAAARAYGVRVSDQVILNQVKAIVSGLGTLEGSLDYYKRLAMSAYPGLADQIKAGMTLEDIASPYVQAMAANLELNPEEIDMFDPAIRSALSATGADGKPTTKTLWQFEQDIRKDSRWLLTNNARESIMGTARQVMKDWGFGW